MANRKEIDTLQALLIRGLFNRNLFLNDFWIPTTHQPNYKFIFLNKMVFFLFKRVISLAFSFSEDVFSTQKNKQLWSFWHLQKHSSALMTWVMSIVCLLLFSTLIYFCKKMQEYAKLLKLLRHDYIRNIIRYRNYGEGRCSSEVWPLLTVRDLQFDLLLKSNVCFLWIFFLDYGNAPFTIIEINRNSCMLGTVTWSSQLWYAKTGLPLPIWGVTQQTILLTEIKA